MTAASRTSSRALAGLWFACLLGALAAASACNHEPPRDPADYDCVMPEGSHDPAHPRALQLQAFLDERVASGLPGVILLASTPEGVFAGSAGRADLGFRVPMRPCNLAPVGSITKTMFASVMLSLADDEVLSLDDRLADWAPPEIIEGIANAGDVTIRQLLNHTGGIPNFTETMAFGLSIVNERNARYSNMERLDLIRGLPPRNAPGEEFFYTNTGYELLVPILEAATGKPHQAALRDRVLIPLGLESTHYVPGNPRPDGVVRGYSDVRGDGTVIDTTDYVISDGSPAGGVTSTALDMKRFIIGLLEGHLLSESALDEMRAWIQVPPNPFLDDPWPTFYGLGMMRIDTPYGQALGHFGGKIGYRSLLFAIPDRDTTLVAFANGAAGQLEWIWTEGFFEVLIEILLG